MSSVELATAATAPCVRHTTYTHSGHVVSEEGLLEEGRDDGVVLAGREGALGVSAWGDVVLEDSCDFGLVDIAEAVVAEEGGEGGIVWGEDLKTKKTGDK